jgi:diguanylate cyclase (GGDEF)-like protein
VTRSPDGFVLAAPGGQRCLVVQSGSIAAAAARSPELPLVALIDDREEEAIEALRDGADECLTTPFDRVALERALRLAVERHQLRARALHGSLHDALTDLPNRRLLDERLYHALAATRRHAGPIALMVLDLDSFKPINDTLGHQAGDDVLIEVGHRLETAVRPSDTVARVGGDEFAVLCEAAGDADAVLSIAERLATDLAEPIDLGEDVGSVLVRASIGVAFATPDACDEDADALLARADAAMYLAKHGDRAIAVAARQAPSSAG